VPQEIILWSARANASVLKLATWLMDHYGEDYAERYMTSIHNTIGGVARHPTKGMVVRKGEVRRWPLDRHNYLLYSIVPGGIVVKDILPYKRLRKSFF
jgi:hypothetical protein